METRYRVTGIRKGDRTAQVITYHDTAGDALYWIAKHREEENNAHAYQIAPVVDGQTLSAIYFVDDNVVTESEWLTATNTKKEVTQ
jgi:broad specificity polyphosphatase/5'/3'-nucleotidase SurE